MRRNHRMKNAPKIATGVLRRTLNGRDQLSYNPARIKNTNRRENPKIAPDVDHPDYALCERTTAAAARLLGNYPREGVATNYGVTCPHAYWEGVVARWQGDSAKAQAAFVAARSEVEKILAKQPDFAAAIRIVK